VHNAGEKLAKSITVEKDLFNKLFFVTPKYQNWDVITNPAIWDGENGQILGLQLLVTIAEP